MKILVITNDGGDIKHRAKVKVKPPPHMLLLKDIDKPLRLNLLWMQHFVCFGCENLRFVNKVARARPGEFQVMEISISTH